LSSGTSTYNSKRFTLGVKPGLSIIYACAFIFFFGCSPKITNVNLPYTPLQNFSLPGEAEVPNKWWLAFEDEDLNILIDTALETNLSLKSVWYQFREAGAFVDIASSARWPDLFLQLQSGISRPEPDFVGGENTQLSFRANYEVDLWGRIRYSVHAEKFRFQASNFYFGGNGINLV
jgi:outer membrane protein TolC